MQKVSLLKTEWSLSGKHRILCGQLIFGDLWEHKLPGCFPSPNHCLATVTTQMNAAMSMVIS